ncbi:hypothetical protein ACFL35_05625, partial [Candidatus Riflebacteria bacterium]
MKTKTENLRGGNTFIASIFVMAILFTFGIIFLAFGINTKNIVRAAYIDQIAAYLAEAGGREVELQVRKQISLELDKTSIWSSVIEKPSGVTQKFKGSSLPETRTLINETNVERIAGGNFLISAIVDFMGVDTNYEPGGLYPNPKPKEKTGNVRIIVDAEYRKSGSKPINFLWKFAKGLDFRVINVLSEIGKTSKFTANPSNDHVLMVKAAGMQNALTDGQVMHPKGAKVVVDGVLQNSTRLLMGTGYGWEDKINAGIRSKKYKPLDIAPLYINIKKNVLPPQNPKELKKIPGESGNMLANKYFPEEKEDLRKQALAKLAKGIAEAKKKAQSGAKEVESKCISEVKKETSGSDPTGEKKKARKKGIEMCKSIAAELLSKWNKEIQAGNAESIRMIKFVLDNLYRCPIKMHLTNMPIFDAIGPSEADEKTSYSMLIDEGHKFAQAKITPYGSTRVANWKKMWTGSKDEWRKGCGAFTGKLKSLTGHNKGVLGNSAFHRRAPIEFKNLLEANMAGNFKKRHFGASVLVWDTKASPVGGLKASAKMQGFPSVVVEGKTLYKGGEYYTKIVKTLESELNKTIKMWKENRPDLPVPFAHPLDPSPQTTSPPGILGVGIKRLWEAVIKGNRRKYPSPR